eukprot:6125950-Prymnesium_polylepis.1
MMQRVRRARERRLRPSPRPHREAARAGWAGRSAHEYSARRSGLPRRGCDACGACRTTWC